MNRTTKILLYLFFTLVALVIFLYVRFPSETARELIVSRLHEISPQLRMETGTVKPTFPPGLKMNQVKIDYDQMPVFQSDHIKLVPNLFSLLGSQKSLNFNAPLGGGVIEGRAQLNTNGKRVQHSLVLNARSVPMSSLDIFKQWNAFKPNGDLNAYVDYDGSKGPGGTAKLKLDITPGRIDFNPPIMGIGQIEFNQIQGEMTLTPRMLQITTLEASGPQLESKISGSILFRQPLSSSRVTLSCSLKPQAAFTAEHKNDMLGGFFSSNAAQTRGIVVRISGTLDNPRYVVR